MLARHIRRFRVEEKKYWCKEINEKDLLAVCKDICYKHHDELRAIGVIKSGYYKDIVTKQSNIVVNAIKKWLPVLQFPHGEYTPKEYRKLGKLCKIQKLAFFKYSTTILEKG